MQTELAEKICVVPNTVSGWINGYKNPGIHSIYDVCDVLNITPNDLMGYSQHTLADYCTDELLAELKRRIENADK